MSFLDDIASAVDRGTASMGRTTEKVKIKNRINELAKQRKNYAAQLGAVLYEATKGNPEFQSSYKELYDAIATCDSKLAECQQKIASLDQEAEEEAASMTVFRCSVCGSIMSGADLFCSGCGTPAEQAKAPAPATKPSEPVCSKCGSPLEDGDVFCMSCGTKVDTPAPEGGSEKSAVDSSTTVTNDSTQS